MQMPGMEIDGSQGTCPETATGLWVLECYNMAFQLSGTADKSNKWHRDN